MRDVFQHLIVCQYAYRVKLQNQLKWHLNLKWNQCRRIKDTHSLLRPRSNLDLKG